MNSFDKNITWVLCVLIIMCGLVMISYNISQSEAVFKIKMDNNTLEAVNNMDNVVDAKYCKSDYPEYVCEYYNQDTNSFVMGWCIK